VAQLTLLRAGVQNRTRRRRGILLASAPWYEFWGHGVWQLGEWTHLHAGGWVWAARGYLLFGVVCVALLMVAMSGEADWLSFAFAAFFVALWLVIPGVTQMLALFALVAPALIVFGLVGEGWKQVRRWSGAMGKLVPAGSNVSSGTYRCTNCGHKMDVGWTDQLPPCPDCNNPEWETLSGGDSFFRDESETWRQWGKRRGDWKQWAKRRDG
jgi:hypothetical protein